MSAEDRIRAALAARAAQVTPERLQPSAPPTTVRRPARSRLPILGAIAGLAAAALLVLVLTRLPGRTSPDVPAAPPSAQPTVSTPIQKPPTPAAQTDGPPSAGAQPGTAPAVGPNQLPGPIPGPTAMPGKLPGRPAVSMTR
jgi:hypothetical protein